MINTAEIFGTPIKRMMDPVHGSISIYSHEQKIIDDPLFQRLRHILQNDVVFLVFPGAKHNRLLHSIGTMHMVSSLFIQITSSYLANKDSNNISLHQKKSIQYIHCCLRLAALLHDTGHCPFSHQFEHAEAIKDIFTPALFKNIWGDIDYKQFYKHPIKGISHEHFSVRIAYEILTKQNIFSQANINIEDVLFFLETTENEASTTLIEHCTNFIEIFVPGVKLLIQGESFLSILNSFLKFLKSFISGELDADKMDYILRDSYFSGCRYGMFNKDHLVNSLRIGYELFNVNQKNVKVGSASEIFDVEFSLAILEKGIGALEDFVYARYQLYLELYNHKTVSGFRKLLSIALSEILSNQSDRQEIELHLSSLAGFSNFTDTFFWQKFRKHSEDNPNSACRMLINRNKLHYIGKRINEKEEDVETLCIRLSKSKGQKIEYWKSHVKFSKINDYFSNIKILVKQEDGTRKLKKISRVTDFFGKFDKKDIYHLFEIPLF
jgi:deoxynucleoside triphosphate triphosphohydrolase SAMHD1